MKNSIIVYKTNAALAYNEWAYLIRLDKSENGFNYLCIGTSWDHSDDNSSRWLSDSYYMGKTVEDLENYYVETVAFNEIQSENAQEFLKMYELIQKHY